MQLKDKNILVLGLGDTGLSALRWLSNQPKQNQAALLSVADTRTEFDTAALKIEMPKLCPQEPKEDKSYSQNKNKW